MAASMCSMSRCGASGLFWAVVVLTASASSATLAAEAGNYALRVQASSAIGAATFLVPPDECNWDPSTQMYCWELAAPVVLSDDLTGELVAMVLEAELEICLAAPQHIKIAFETTAGAATTEFTLTSDRIVLGGGVAEGRLLASASVADLGGGGAILVGRGAFSGIGIAQAFCEPVGAGDVLFTHLLGVIRVGNGGSASVSQRDPADGSYRPMAANAANAFARCGFALSALDRAAVEMTYAIHEIPECRTDLNGDGLVDVQDLLTVLVLYGTVEGGPGYDSGVDIDGDGAIGLGDLVMLLHDYGQPC